MPRLSSTSSGSDVTVEPRLISRPVNELTDDEFLAEVTRLQGERGTTTAQAHTRKAAAPTKSVDIDIDDLG